MGDEKALFYRTITTPLGPFTFIANESYLLQAEFQEYEDLNSQQQAQLVHGERLAILAQAAAEITAYFAGTLQEFTVPYRLQTTPFRQRVWSELTQIPYGQTISYQTLACRVGNPKACRAVGQANHFNPLSIIVPCHRVIGKDGKLVGYGGGLDKKTWLIDWEKKCV